MTVDTPSIAHGTEADTASYVKAIAIASAGAIAVIEWLKWPEKESKGGHIPFMEVFFAMKSCKAQKLGCVD